MIPYPTLKCSLWLTATAQWGTLALLMLAIKLIVVKVAQCTSNSLCKISESTSFSSFRAHSVAKMMQGAFKMNLYLQWSIN